MPLLLIAVGFTLLGHPVWAGWIALIGGCAALLLVTFEAVAKAVK